MNNLLTLIIPEFFSILDIAQLNQWKSLKLLLARASISRSEYDVTDELLNYFSGVSSADLPAVLLGKAKTFSENPWVCLAEPIHIQPNRDHLSIIRADFPDISSAQALQFIEELNQFFVEDNIHFHLVSNRVWLVESPYKLVTPTVKAGSIVAKDISPFFPAITEVAGIKKLFSDIQLMLHHSKTNMERSKAGLLEMNSLWLSNEGQYPEKMTSKLSLLISDDELALKLAQACGIPTSSNIEDIFRKETTGQVLYMSKRNKLDDIFPALFFEKLYDAVKNKRYTSVNFITNRAKLTIKPSTLRKFWQRTFSLEAVK